MVDVFVIDDDSATADLMVRLLRLDGLSAQCETDSAKALSAMQEAPPKLVVLDWMMPAVGGDEVLRQMKDNDVLKEVRVLVYSAAGADAEAKAVRAGAAGFIRKAAMDVPALLGTIKRYIPS